jgi:hypothetical protein
MQFTTISINTGRWNSSAGRPPLRDTKHSPKSVHAFHVANYVHTSPPKHPLVLDSATQTSLGVRKLKVRNSGHIRQGEHGDAKQTARSMLASFAAKQILLPIDQQAGKGHDMLVIEYN